MLRRNTKKFRKNLVSTIKKKKKKSPFYCVNKKDKTLIGEEKPIDKLCNMK